MSLVIRKLIQQYYSIQDLRVVAYERIVNFLKLYRDDILRNLKSHMHAVTHDKDASHTIFGPHLDDASQNGDVPYIGFASHRQSETQNQGASHITAEPHWENASHNESESQLASASQNKIETHHPIASQKTTESQSCSASHKKFESHSKSAGLIGDEQIKIAIQLLENRKYSEFAKRFLIKSQWTIETQDISASPILKAVLDVSEDISILIEVHNRLYEIEKWLYKKLDVWSEDHPLRKNYLSKVKGIGPVLASGIIAFLSEPIKKATYVSQIWSYCGLAPQQMGMQRRGVKLNYDPFLKGFVVFRLGRSLLMFNKFAKKLYDAFKADAKMKHPDWSKLHLHNHARRKVVKLFIASVWEVWREMNGLPVTEPYPIAVLGHKTKITPWDWVGK